jgi:hypothetical protein
MKRDMDLIRKLMLRLEELDGTGISNSNLLEGYGAEEVMYHNYLLANAGLAIGCDSSSGDSFLPQWYLNALTWDGHEFLDAARNETNWKKAKERFAGVGGFSLSILKDLLVALMKQQIGL